MGGFKYQVGWFGRGDAGLFDKKKVCKFYYNFVFSGQINHMFPSIFSESHY
jgi:hypothetical protein